MRCLAGETINAIKANEWDRKRELGGGFMMRGKVMTIPISSYTEVTTKKMET